MNADAKSQSDGPSVQSARKQGAFVSRAGVHYCVWCPSQPNLNLEITAPDGAHRALLTHRQPDGYHEAEDPFGRAGDLYNYRFPDGRMYPDPASRAQAEDVRSPSVVVDPSTFVWTDGEWQRPDFRDLVIYELHVGTFTPEGTFLAAIQRLPHLQALGVNAIEVMPLADFPGRRNWGYDGVLLYAPAHAYGAPDDLRALVDAAHGLGLAVIQDVVYNHLGPDGNCLGAFAAEYFNDSRQTPWGASLNYDGPLSEHVREFLAGNAEHWMDDYHMDGVRLDATHWIVDSSQPHLIAEISRRVHQRGGYVIAEDERNEARLVEPGGLGCDAVWADDYHHSVRVGQTGERHAYLQDFSGTLEETVDTLQHGWLFRGQKHGRLDGHLRGTLVSHIPPSGLIHCISNHDQTGNRAFGERLHAMIPPVSYRAISMMLCLSPYTPMLFMGQEWACSTSFLFFTDHHADLGRLVTEGRRREFIAFPEFNDPARLNEIPDPQAEATFWRSKLNWDELPVAGHHGVLALYRECLRLRQEHIAFRPLGRSGWEAGIAQQGVGYIRLEEPGVEWLVLFHLWPGPEPLDMSLKSLPWKKTPASWELVLSSNEERFGGSGTHIKADDAGYLFGQAETLLLRGKVA